MQSKQPLPLSVMCLHFPEQLIITSHYQHVVNTSSVSDLSHWNKTPINYGKLVHPEQQTKVLYRIQTMCVQSSCLFIRVAD